MEPTYAPPPAAEPATPEPQSGSGRKKLDMLLKLAQRAFGGGVDRIRPREGQGPAPLSFGQERLWLLHRLDPASPAYNIPGAFRLPRVDAAALERALAELVRRHDALRTTFHEVDGAAVQRVQPFGAFTLEVEELSGADEAEVARRVEQEAVRPYDLTAGPLFRPRLLRLGGDDVLLLNLHHAIADGWSLGVMLRELSALYAADLAGEPSPLPAPELQYADYAAWQRERMSGAALDRQLEWWRERLAGAPALLDLPADHPRPAVQTYRGGGASMELSAGLRERLRALGRGEDATLFMVLLAAFQSLLARYGAGDDVVVGTPVSGRGRPEVEGMVGFFVNTVVLRTGLGGDPAFREVVGRVREVVLNAFEHQEMPFDRLVAELQPGRSLGHSPLFQVMFTADAAPDAAGVAPALDARPLAVDTGTAQFDLTLGISETAEGIRASVTYAADLFEPATIHRLLVHLSRVLEQAAADPGVRLSALRLLDGAERRTLVEEWNRTERPYPRNVCIHELFESMVRERPDAPALAWNDLHLTYEELDARANRLAHHLIRRGVGPESRVGVLLERGAELIVSLLAILKAGGCYVPLDPAYPPERLGLMLEDAGVRVLLTRSGVADVPPVDKVAIIHLDQSADALAAERTDAPRGGASAENLAYIVYTSGSTGKPKGVMVAHRHVVQLVRETDYVQLAPGDRVAQASSASFDALTFEAWGALLNGATLVGIDREILLSPPALYAFLREQRITTLYQTTALLNQLSRELPDIFAPLREVLFGGQASDADRVRALLRTGRPQRLLHMYGPTETTAWCSYEDVHHVEPDALTVSVGRPTGNQRIYILDGMLEPAPVGVPGECWVGGDGVVRGYLDRPGLTAERFVPDPFAPQPGARMYRTGDRMRWRAEGTLEFVGRLDDQVKIRGFRIEPGEVESVLAAHPDVREARVIVREDQPGEKRLVAYVVGDADADTLRADLRRGLPEYMVPAAFVTVNSLPLTLSGKLDVRALPAPEMAAEDRYVAPRTPVEEVLAGIWSALLGVERVGISDNFFEMGGHSLLATRVISRVRAVLDAELPLRALFENPTVGALAGVVEEARRDGASALPPVVPLMRRPPLSFAQERLWFLDRMQPGSTTYNMHSALRLSGPLNTAALAHALGEVVRRQEALRTVFREADGAPVQVILPVADFRLAVEDLSRLGPAEREDEVRRRVDAEAARPFDLAAGPLFRAALLVLTEREHVLWMGMHHAVSDGWSLGVLHRELATLYGAYAEGRESPLDELAVRYTDYAVWQRQQLSGEFLDSSLAWWRERLAGAPALMELPTDHPRPPVQTFGGATLPVTVPAGVLKALIALGHAEGATLFMVLLGAFQILLARYGGGDDVVVGTPVSGRTHAEVEPLVGFFVNMLALRTDLSGDPSFREVLRRVRQTTLGAFDHQDVPFEKLVAELQPGRSLGHPPLFQVMFTLDAARPAEPELPGLTVEEIAAGDAAAKFDLTLGLAAADQGLAGALTWRTDLWNRATMERMVEHLGRVLEQVAANPGVRLSAIELLDAGERRRVLEEWNHTDTPYPAGASIPSLFAEQAARTPDAAAVVHGGRSVAYRELDARATQIAHHLLSLGVQPEDRVGVCLERGPEMVAAMLGILKAGGAYVPLDPSHPRERLAFMTADAGMRVLLTQESLRGSTDLHPVRGSTDPHPVRVVSLDGDAAAIASAPAAAPRIAAGARSLAYIIYTSGSTGTPKGVAVEHRSVVRLVRDSDYVHPEAGTRIAQVSNAAFDAATFEIWGALLNGGTVIVIPRETALSPTGMADALRALSIDTVFLTSSLFAGISSERPDAFASLGTLMVGGEALDPAAVRRVLHAGAPRRLLNAYGPTENTTFSSWHLVDALADDARSVPIGRNIAHSTLLVLDDTLHPAPVGVPGELFVGGDGVARGYFGRAALTAERFVPDPFASRPGERMYRTGDRARWTPAGVVEYLGRLDGQVKVRGFRVELGEIEATLAAHPAVAGCTVITRADAAGTRQVVAYVVGNADAEELRAHLRRTLPDYMVPAAFVPLALIPLTPNGKVDHRALPAPDFAGAADEYAPPRTPVEEVLAGIWSVLLGVERVGIRDNFFEMGGHSLLATRVLSRVRAVLGAYLPLRALFDHPTVATLAGVVEEARRDGTPALPPVVPVVRQPPLSFAQERLWFLDRMQPGSTTYNMHSALRLSGPLDVPALERALGEVVRRHEALRTVFREADGAPVQVILPVDRFRLATEDLSHLGETERGDEVRRRVEEETARPFDLSAGPLFRAVLLVLGEGEHVLWMGMHHAVSDGWSLGVLHRELAALYAAFAEGREPPLGELPVQYADYAVWQRQQLGGEFLDRSLAWWRERLAGAPALLELPTDRPRPPVQTFGGDTIPVAIPVSVLKPLRDLGHAEGATLFMVLLGAFQTLLSRYGGGDDVVVGTPVSGRARGEVEELIGFFVNTLALRTDLSGDPTFREVLRRARETTLGAFDHQEVPFEKLVAELQPERSLSHSPLFQVMFTLDAAGATGPGLPGLEVEEMAAGDAAAKFDLTLGLAAAEDGLAGALTWRTDLWDRATVERMMEHLGRVLEQVAADPGMRLSQLELLGAGERRVVLEEWNRTAFRHADARPVHERFAEWAARTPDAPAFIHGDQTLTYAGLDRRAGSVARRLRSRGVKPDVPVGVCLERGPELVASLLGVLRAGGAYVALDPAYPAERLDAMIADSGARVLLTRRALAAALPVRPGVEVVDVEGWMADEDPASTEAEEPAESVGPRNLAYVIYTSGSTGTPKAVGVEHAGLANLCAWHEAAFAVTAQDRATQLASPGFDASAWEVWPYLTRGACVEVVPDAVRADPAALRDWLVRRRVTVAFVPTPLAEPLLALPWPAETALRWLLAGGDRLATRPGAHLPFALSNNYGPTETTVVATSGLVTPEGARAPSIGRPLHNTRCYVLSPTMRPLPAGVPGELYVGGAQVARGYLGRPAMTAERFVPDPFSHDAGARMYRTGDRVRWRADGALESLGRLDEQAKIRGFRIEPGEVEAALRRHPGVRDCAVLVREDTPGDRRLAAYVVGGADAAELRAHLRRTLPDYMVPAAIVALDALPVTPGGKLDRRALPAPAAPAPAEGAVVPAGGVEARMAAVWREVLGVAALGMEDNFFDLGGHSLLLVKLQARVAAEFGIQVPVVELFQFPTARALAGRVARGADTAAVEEGGERGGARQAGVSRLEARRAAGRARRP